MPLAYVAYVRAYERAGSGLVARSPTSFPPDIYRWLDSRYQARYVDEIDNRPGLVGFHLLSAVSVYVNLPRAGPVPLLLHRAVVDSPHIEVCDAIVWAGAEPEGFPEELHDEAWSLLIGDCVFNSKNWNCPRTLSSLWDEAVHEVLGVDPKQWRKTGFGGLGVFTDSGSSADGVIRRSMSERSSAAMEGVMREHRVVFERNRCTVVLPDREDLEVARGGYLLLAALFGRSRHFAWTLLADVTALAERCTVSGRDADASRVLEEAAELQRRGVLARREMRATDYLGDPTLISLFNRAAPVAAVAEYDRRGLDDALEGLDRLVNGVFAVASDRSQRRLNQVGFVIALISVLLAATGMTDLPDARPEVRELVYATWIVSIMVLGVVVSAARAHRTARVFIGRTRRTGRPKRVAESDRGD